MNTEPFIDVALKITPGAWMVIPEKLCPKGKVETWQLTNSEKFGEGVVVAGGIVNLNNAVMLRHYHETWLSLLLTLEEILKKGLTPDNQQRAEWSIEKAKKIPVPSQRWLGGPVT